MQDTRLRQKLFGQFSEDCLNLYAHSCYSNLTRGFVGQTVYKVTKNFDEIRNLRYEVGSLQADRDYLIRAVDELKEKVEQLTKKTSKKRK